VRLGRGSGHATQTRSRIPWGEMRVQLLLWRPWILGRGAVRVRRCVAPALRRVGIRWRIVLGRRASGIERRVALAGRAAWRGRGRSDVDVDEAVGNELVCDIKPGIRGDTNLLSLVGGFIADGDSEKEPARIHSSE